MVAWNYCILKPKNEIQETVTEFKTQFRQKVLTKKKEFILNSA